MTCGVVSALLVSILVGLSWFSNEPWWRLERVAVLPREIEEAGDTTGTSAIVWFRLVGTRVTLKLSYHAPYGWLYLGDRFPSSALALRAEVARAEAEKDPLERLAEIT